MKIQGILRGQEVFQNSIVQEKAAKLIFFLPYILQLWHRLPTSLSYWHVGSQNEHFYIVLGISRVE